MKKCCDNCKFYINSECELKVGIVYIPAEILNMGSFYKRFHTFCNRFEQKEQWYMHEYWFYHDGGDYSHNKKISKQKWKDFIEVWNELKPVFIPIKVNQLVDKPEENKE